MPRYLVENALAKFHKSAPVKVYGDTVFTTSDKTKIHSMARYLCVSYTALVIRLRDLNLLEYHDVTEYIAKELHIGGAVH